MGWDVFQLLPPKKNSTSEKNEFVVTKQIFKTIAYVVVFVFVLCGAVISKSSFLFMTSQVRPHKQVMYCNKDLELDKQYVAEVSNPEMVAWIWCIACAFLVPEAVILFNSAW